MKNKVLKDSLVIGFAQFAIFFGAGNLIFPPMIGLATGEHVAAGLIGMTLAGILLPMMAVWAIGNMGTDIYDITQPVTKWWHHLYIIVSIPIVCLGTIPRCGGVAYEIGLLGILPVSDGNLPDPAGLPDKVDPEQRRLERHCFRRYGLRPV